MCLCWVDVGMDVSVMKNEKIKARGDEGWFI